MQKVIIKQQQQRTGKYETFSYSFTLKRGRFFLQGENLPTSGLLSKERPIKIDHPVQVSGMPASKRVNDTNICIFNFMLVNFSFLYDQFV